MLDVHADMPLPMWSRCWCCWRLKRMCQTVIIGFKATKVNNAQGAHTDTRTPVHTHAEREKPLTMCPAVPHGVCVTFCQLPKLCQSVDCLIKRTLCKKATLRCILNRDIRVHWEKSSRDVALKGTWLQEREKERVSLACFEYTPEMIFIHLPYNATLNSHNFLSYSAFFSR